MAELLQNPDVELDERESDGITVKLWLIPDSKSTYVTIDDKRQSAFHVVPVPEPELAGEVFKHPFAYLVEAGGLAVGGTTPDYLPDFQG